MGITETLRSKGGAPAPFIVLNDKDKKREKKILSLKLGRSA